ncbi:MAG: hypothetical protein ACREC0_00790, partial [Methylocella sp.]
MEIFLDKIMRQNQVIETMSVSPGSDHGLAPERAAPLPFPACPCASGPAMASSILYTDFGPGQTFATNPATSWVVQVNQWVGAPFIPSMTASLDSVDLGASFVFDLLTAEVATDNAGVPGTILATIALPG